MAKEEKAPVGVSRMGVEILVHVRRPDGLTAAQARELSDALLNAAVDSERYANEHVFNVTIPGDATV